MVELSSILIVIFSLFQLPKGRSVCCDLSLRGPKHAQQRTTPQDRGVLLVSREEGQGQTITLTVTHIHEPLLFKHPQPIPRVTFFLLDTDIKSIQCLPGTIFAPYPLSNAGSLLQLLDAMHSPQKAEMISSLERFGVFLISLRRKSSQS